MADPGDRLAVVRGSVADALSGLPGVEAVALGGSRAQGTARPDSDWDVSVYYRHGFDPASVRSLGWPSELSEIGGWGPVFNGGGKIDVDGQIVDLHYRDLGLIDRIHDAAERGEFTIERLLFHQAGLPSYILLAELGINETLRGSLPDWGYPEALRRSAPQVWWSQADLTFGYAEAGHARRGRVTQCAGLLGEAACMSAHAVLAGRGEWVTNEKGLLERAELGGVDDVVANLEPDPDVLLRSVVRARRLCLDAVRSVR